MARRSTRRHPASSPAAHGNEDGGLNTKTAPVAAASASDLPVHSLASRSKSGQQDVTATAADSASSASQQVTRRRTRNLPSASDTKMDVESQHSSSRRRRPGEDGAGDDEPTLHDIDLRTSSSRTAGSGSLATRNQWIVLAVASGACAAFNGVFAKL